MIVLSQQQYDFLVGFKVQFQPLLDGRHIDFAPIPIKPDASGNAQFILPEDLLNDVGFSEIKQALIDGGHLEKMFVREVTQDELLPSGITNG